MDQREQQQAACAFVARWQAAEGNEQREANSFWIELLGDVLGVASPTRVLDFERKVRGRRIDVFCEDRGILIENKSRGVSLDAPEPRGKNRDGSPRMVTPYEQARWYADNITPRSIAPRWIITCNFDELRIYDTNEEYPERTFETISLEELPNLLHRLGFFTRTEASRAEREKELSVKAGEVVGRLYDKLASRYHDIEHDAAEQRSLNILITRIVFLLYAEDARLLHEHQAFYHYLEGYSIEGTAPALTELFRVLNTPDAERGALYASEKALAFPYINGGLFEEEIAIPPFDDNARVTLLLEASAKFDWANISPTIFGAVFESTLNPETRRAGGMHYTSVENIHKVIDPLFLDALKAELVEIEGEKVLRTREQHLVDFQHKLAHLRVLDPAAGSGNFLTETYIQLRRLENRVLASLNAEAVLDLGQEGSTVEVSIDQLYGIEINDFAVNVAKTALWIAEAQMAEETAEVLHRNVSVIPLKSVPGIVCANALRIDWNSVLPAEECSYIIGNPPFLGSSIRSKEQTADLEVVFGNEKKWGKCDYCVGWYRKAADYMKGTSCHAALVSTNSITQGEQVEPTWRRLFDMGITINFAWRTFIWNSEAIDQAHVHCVIVGFSYDNNTPKMLFANNGAMEVASNINGYLVNAPNLFLPSRCQPIDSMHKPMIQGCKPVDGGGLVLSSREREDLILRYPQTEAVVKQYLGAEEYINGKARYCLWLKNADPALYAEIPEIAERLATVKQQRQASPTKEFREYADRPHLFVQDRHPDCDYLIVPQVSGERRRYVPIGFLSSDVIMSNAAYGIPGADVFDFGIVSSLMLNAWMRAVAGRLKSDYRFSPVVYNTLVYPQATDEQRAEIECCAQAVLDARDAHPGKSLAEMYDGISPMPENPSKADLAKYDQREYDDLRAAHTALDAAVEAAYGVNFAGDEEKIVAHLFRLYAPATKDEKSPASLGHGVAAI